MAENKILIVDDDKELTNMQKIVLENKGYQIIVSNDPQSGFEKLEKEKPDLVILDVMMEGKAAGFIFSRKMRKERRFDNIPILMLTGMRKDTGFFFPGETKNNVFLPVDEFVEKPVEPDVLIEKVEKLLKKVSKK